MRKVFTFEELRNRIGRANRYFHTMGVLFLVIVIPYLIFLGYTYFSVGPKIGTAKNLEAVGLVIAGKSSGSAFLVDNKKGLALTAAHVVRGTDRVTLSFKKVEVSCEAEVAVKDEEKDVALLKLKGNFSKISPLELGDSDSISEQDQVLVVGYPDGEWSITDGIISYVGRDTFRTNAATNPGNSGGPLIMKEHHKVVGIMIQRKESIDNRVAANMAYALPINSAVKVLKEKGFTLEKME